MKSCGECGKVVAGRSDKKFCSDECRIAYNNRRYRDDLTVVLSVNRILKKNYIILNRIYLKGIRRTDLITLSESGFNRLYFTSVKESRTGRRKEYFCYDLSFSINEKLEVRIKKHIFV